MIEIGDAILHTGDCLETIKDIPDGTVQTCITSPPYFGLRDYGMDGQIGLESTIDDYINTLVRLFREVRRTLKDDGTLWLNLGDSYSPFKDKGVSIDRKNDQGKWEEIWPNPQQRIRIDETP